MREIRLSGSEGGGTEFNRLSLPLSYRDDFDVPLVRSIMKLHSVAGRCTVWGGLGAIKKILVPRQQMSFSPLVQTSGDFIPRTR